MMPDDSLRPTRAGGLILTMLVMPATQVVLLAPFLPLPSARADEPDAGLQVIGPVPLAEADAADMIDAPSPVCGADDTLHVAWVSEMAPGGRTILLASAAPGAPLGAPRTLATTGVFVSESTMPQRGGPPRTVR